MKDGYYCQYSNCRKWYYKNHIWFMSNDLRFCSEECREKYLTELDQPQPAKPHIEETLHVPKYKGTKKFPNGDKKRNPVEIVKFLTGVIKHLDLGEVPGLKYTYKESSNSIALEVWIEEIKKGKTIDVEDLIKRRKKIDNP